jgi:hypothetical protein
MDEQVAALMNLVREEISLYRDLIDHARKKTAVLIRGPLEAILESNKIDETFNVKLRMLENEVGRLCQQLSSALHIAREEFTLLTCRRPRTIGCLRDQISIVALQKPGGAIERDQPAQPQAGGKFPPLFPWHARFYRECDELVPEQRNVPALFRRPHHHLQQGVAEGFQRGNRFL